MFKGIWIKLLIMALLINQSWAVYITLRYPSYGVLVEQNAQNQWVITDFEARAIGEELHLKAGDIITKVNGEEPEHHPQLRTYHTLDKADTLTVILADSGATTQLSMRNVAKPDWLPLAAEIFSMAIAFWLYRNADKSDSYRRLSLVFLSIGMLFLNLPASIRGDTMCKIIISGFMMMVPIVFFRFLTVFLKEKSGIELPGRWIRPFYVLAPCVCTAQFLFFFDTPLAHWLYSKVIVIVLLIAVSGILATLGFLLSVYRKHRKTKSYVTIIVKTVFISLLCSFAPVITLSFLPKILFAAKGVNSFYMSCFVFIFPLSFVYLLASRRLYDMDMLIRRWMFTSVIALVPSLLFTLMIKLLFPQEATVKKLVIVELLLLAGISLILYSLENVTTKLEPALFPRKYRLQNALKRISSDLGTISSFREMKDIILVDIVQTLGVAGGAIVFRYQDSMEIIAIGTMRHGEVEQLVKDEDWDNPTYICMEVSRQEEYTSYLVMTQKKSTTMLGLEEVQWLNLIVTYLAVSLENIQLIRKLDHKVQMLSSLIPEEEEAENLVWFRKLMFELQEKERIRIATDLHDTTMQDLFFLKARLRSLVEKYVYTKEDHAGLTSLMDYIDIINMNLRQSCFELHPHLLKEIGLEGTLNKLVATERTLSSFQIQLDISDRSLIEQQDLDMKRHLFRLVQELLNNAKKHAQPSCLRISLYVHQEMLVFEYTDDGIGFEPNHKVDTTGLSGIGLQQMKSRILSLGGQYELKSGAGKGMKFYAFFPIREERHA